MPDENFEVHGKAYAVIPEWILYSRVNASAVRLFGVLGRHLGLNEAAWPSRKRIAKKMGCSLSTVDRAIEQLEKIKAIRVEPRFIESGQTSSFFYLWPFEDPSNLTAPVVISDDTPSSEMTSPPSSEEVYERTLNNKELKENNVATPAESPTTPPLKPKKTYAPEVYELNNYLCQLIEHNGSRVPTGGEAEMDALLRIDKMYPPQVRAVIDWCQSDPFWHTNILSAKTLRKQYDKLRLRMKADGIHLPQSFSPDLLEQAKAWDAYYEVIRQGAGRVKAPSFPCPQDSQGNLLDSEGRAYYIDQMDFKRRYVDDE